MIAKVVLGAIGTIVGVWGLALLIDLILGREIKRAVEGITATPTASH